MNTNRNGGHMAGPEHPAPVYELQCALTYHEMPGSFDWSVFHYCRKLVLYWTKFMTSFLDLDVGDLWPVPGN